MGVGEGHDRESSESLFHQTNTEEKQVSKPTKNSKRKQATPNVDNSIKTRVILYFLRAGQNLGKEQ